MENLRILSTVHKLIYDVLSVINNEKMKDEPFEIGVKCKTEEIQLKIYKILTAVFLDHENMRIEMKEDDNVVSIIKNKIEILN
jgi:hypothetical protein